MQIQFITTAHELQEAIDQAINLAIQKIQLPSESNQLERPVTVKELCDFLGVTEPTIIRWRKKGKIPFLQIGSRILFQKTKVIAELERQGKRV